jgi:hypothetical protein
MLHRRPWGIAAVEFFVRMIAKVPVTAGTVRKHTHGADGESVLSGKGWAGTPRVGRRWRRRPSQMNRISAGGCARFRFLEFYGAQGLFKDAKKSDLPDLPGFVFSRILYYLDWPR